MNILIIKDGGATKVPKEVAGMEDVQALRDKGFEVEVIDSEPTPEVVSAEAPAEAAAAPAKSAKSAKHPKA